MVLGRLVKQTQGDAYLPWLCCSHLLLRMTLRVTCAGCELLCIASWSGVRPPPQSGSSVHQAALCRGESAPVMGGSRTSNTLYLAPQHCLQTAELQALADCLQSALYRHP